MIHQKFPPPNPRFPIALSPFLSGLKEAAIVEYSVSFFNL